MRATDTSHRVVLAAIAWWRSHRPVDWTLEQHLENPAINAYYTNQSCALAKAVGKLIKEQGEPC